MIEFDERDIDWLKDDEEVVLRLYPDFCPKCHYLLRLHADGCPTEADAVDRWGDR